MNSVDAVILTAYLLCLTYFLYKIVQSFNDEFIVQVNEDSIKQQLNDRNLQDLLEIKFKFEKQYEYNALKQVGVGISNKSSDHSIYVDWDYSSFNDLEKRSRRVTRLAPGVTLDLSNEQVFSTIAPNTVLKETITAEDTLQRKSERKDKKLDTPSPVNLELEVAKPLIDLKPEKPSDDLKKRLGKFTKAQIDLEFFLELAFRFAGADQTFGGDRVHVLCQFTLRKLPWQAGLPWNPKK
ncbi:MAG TPA: hypothetical protein V6D18_00660 [Thermosynechococcaceae cyanobacterium]